MFGDIIMQLLMKRLNITADQMAKRHTKLDGHMDFNEDWMGEPWRRHAP